MGFDDQHGFDGAQDTGEDGKVTINLGMKAPRLDELEPIRKNLYIESREISNLTDQ